MLINSPNDVCRVVMAMDAHKNNTDIKGDALSIRKFIDCYRKQVLDVGPKEVHWSIFFHRLAAMCLRHIQDSEMFLELTPFAEFLMYKHSRYGAEPLLEWGELGLLVRITSKWARVENIESALASDSPDESLRDTLEDIVGYCVLGHYMRLYTEAK